MTNYEKRAAQSRTKLEVFSKRLEAALGEISKQSSRDLIGNHTCIFAVGSGGRLELSGDSDLDAFIVRDMGGLKKEPPRIDEILIQGALINLMKNEHFKDPDNDAKFLRLHTKESLIDYFGSVDDDSENTFTVRMLLLLESRVLVGEDAYDSLIKSVIEECYRNHSEYHSNDYLPIILINDIIRYWRIVLLNYENWVHRNSQDANSKYEKSDKKSESLAILEKEKEEIDRKRRVKSYKLQFQRCITCYSAILYLLSKGAQSKSKNKVVNITTDNMIEMVKLTPVDRICYAKGQHESISAELSRAIELYDFFLASSENGSTSLEEVVVDDAKRTAMSERARDFTLHMFKAISKLGEEVPELYRYVVM